MKGMSASIEGRMRCDSPRFSLSCSVILSVVVVREASDEVVEGPLALKTADAISRSSPQQLGSTDGNSFQRWCHCGRVWGPSTSRPLRECEAATPRRMTGGRVVVRSYTDFAVSFAG